MRLDAGPEEVASCANLGVAAGNRWSGPFMTRAGGADMQCYSQAMDSSATNSRTNDLTLRRSVGIGLRRWRVSTMILALLLIWCSATLYVGRTALFGSVFPKWVMISGHDFRGSSVYEIEIRDGALEVYRAPEYAASEHPPANTRGRAYLTVTERDFRNARLDGHRRRELKLEPVRMVGFPDGKSFTDAERRDIADQVTSDFFRSADVRRQENVRRRDWMRDGDGVFSVDADPGGVTFEYTPVDLAYVTRVLLVSTPLSVMAGVIVLMGVATQIRYRHANSQCVWCGYQLTSDDANAECSECGRLGPR